MYFSSVSADVKIYKADMDGKNQVVLANFPKTAPTLVDVALYKPAKRLFFSDQYNNLIRYIELETLEVRTFSSGTHHPRFLTVYNHTLFWTADGEGQFSGTIFMAKATGGSMPQMMIDGFWDPSGIYAFNSNASQGTGNSLHAFSRLEPLYFFLDRLVCFFGKTVGVLSN